MDIAQTGLRQQPFHASGQPVAFVPYHAQLAAHHFLRMILKDDRGIGVFYGPEASGKKCIVREFLRSMPAGIPVAVIDAARLKTRDLLTALLSQYDPGPTFESVDDCWYALRVFLAEKTRTGQAPLVVLENINKMYPSGLYTLNKLAELQIQGQYLLRMILTSGKAPFAIMHAPSMAAVAKRSISAFELGPMTPKETSTYLHAKLRASGCDNPDKIFPIEINDDLHTESGGWPGKLDRLAMQAMERAEEFPITREHLSPPVVQATPEKPPLAAVVEPVEDPGIQRLFLTFNRKTLQEIDLTESKVLIGRSELCDVSIESRFVSKHHALLVRTDNALHLLDLNSTNGTFVNSRRIQSEVLRHDDIISVGNHGIKLICPAYRARPVVEELDLAETSTLKTLADIRPPTYDDGEDAVPAETGEG